MTKLIKNSRLISQIFGMTVKTQKSAGFLYLCCWHPLWTVISQLRIVELFCLVPLNFYNSQDASCKVTSSVLIYFSFIPSVFVLQWVAFELIDCVMWLSGVTQLWRPELYSDYWCFAVLQEWATSEDTFGSYWRQRNNNNNVEFWIRSRLWECCHFTHAICMAHQRQCQWQNKRFVYTCLFTIKGIHANNPNNSQLTVRMWHWGTGIGNLTSTVTKDSRLYMAKACAY